MSDDCFAWDFVLGFVLGGYLWLAASKHKMNAIQNLARLPDFATCVVPPDLILILSSERFGVENLISARGMLVCIASTCEHCESCEPDAARV